MNERRQKADPALRYLQRMQAIEPVSAPNPHAVPEKPKKSGHLDKISQFVADYPVGSAAVNPDPEADIRTHGIRKRTQEVITQAYEVALERDTRRNQVQRSRMAARVVITRSALVALLICTAAGAFGAGWWLANAFDGSGKRLIAYAGSESNSIRGGDDVSEADVAADKAAGLVRAMWCPSCKKWTPVPPDVLLGRTGDGAMCPVHKVPLSAEKPTPQRNPSRPE